MRVKILLLGILFSFKVILSRDVYIPRNEREKNYLEKVRSEKLVLGTETDYFADEKIEGESLNDIIMELLNDYLQLNVEIEIKNWNTIYKDFKEKNELYGMKIVKVNDVNIENVDYYVGTSFDTLKEWYNLNLLRLPETTIGIRKEYEELKDIINNALTEKYSTRIDNWIKNVKNYCLKINF